MQLVLSKCAVRSWRPDDLGSLVANADNHNLWLNLRDRFPHPYTRRAGREFIRQAMGQRPETMFAITVDDEAVGGMGFTVLTDVERVSAEIGYWLGEPYWGRGIVTEALVAITRYAIDTFRLTRVYALPFASNKPSCRVLEKAGYTLEAHLRRSAIKDGHIVDQLQYSFIVEAPQAQA